MATVLLGVGVAGLMSAATIGLRSQRSAEYRSTALYFAQEKMAELDMTGAGRWTQGYPTKGSEQRFGVDLNWTLALDALEIGQLYDVRLTVNWSAGGRTGQVALQTLLNDYRYLTAESEEDREPLPDEVAPEISY